MSERSMTIIMTVKRTTLWQTRKFFHIAAKLYIGCIGRCRMNGTPPGGFAMPLTQQIIYGAVALAAVLCAIKIFSMPFKLFIKIIVNTIAGFCLLLLFNLIGKPFGITASITVFTVCTVAFMGLPGFALLLMAQWLFR